MHRFDQKMYKINVYKNDHYFVIAYSKTHAIVELVNFNIENGNLDFAGEYNVKDVHLMTEKEMSEIIIDYNYTKDKVEQETLLDAFKELTKYQDNTPEFYGVVSDDFVDYN